MKASHALEALLVRALVAGARALPPSSARAAGEQLGRLAHAAGLRRAVAEGNLRRAFPEWPAARRAAVLAAHYRALGRVCAEYVRLPELVHAPEGEVVAEVRGLEHLEQAREAGRGAILLTGHFGNFELVGAWLGRMHPVDFVVKPLSNPGVEALLARARQRAGVGQIPLGAGMRRSFEALRANRWVALLADQDARRQGIFVPFLGSPASTPAGPAELALRTGAPIIMGFALPCPDGRYFLEVDPPLGVPDPRAPDAVLRLTAAHVARLEARVRERPELWFWLHRRWKTAPPVGAPEARIP